MLGAIIGDIVGSRFEWDNHRSKEFRLFDHGCMVTDDSIMTLGVAQAILKWKVEGGELGAHAVNEMRRIGQPYPYCGYGGRFYHWMYDETPRPYGSFGNGAAMRVSACGFAAKSIEEAKQLSHAVTAVTHNHPEGIKGAEAVAVAIYMARTGASMADIRTVVERDYYAINFTLDEIRPEYRFNETCQDTVPQAFAAFLESTGFEDAIRNAISIGGDSDTLAAITGSIAQAYYGIPGSLREQALTYLDNNLRPILDEFEARYM